MKPLLWGVILFGGLFLLLLPQSAHAWCFPVEANVTTCDEWGCHTSTNTYWECTVGGSGGGETFPTGGGAGGTGGGGGGSTTGMPLTPSQQQKLHVGKTRAFQMLGQPSCSGMFAELGLSIGGVQVLNETTYRNGGTSGVCSSGIAAWTTVGGRLVRLCSSFTNLQTRTAARKILHEALHGAGLKEKPYPGATMFPNEIDSFVAERCQ